jgi:hypothetical protein
MTDATARKAHDMNTSELTLEKLNELRKELMAQKKAIMTAEAQARYTQAHDKFFADLLLEIDGKGKGVSTQNMYHTGGFNKATDGWAKIAEALGVTTRHLTSAVLVAGFPEQAQKFVDEKRAAEKIAE